MPGTGHECHEAKGGAVRCTMSRWHNCANIATGASMREQVDGSDLASGFLEFRQDQRLEDDLKSENTREDWERILLELEMFGPYTAAAAECPFFVTTPPTLLPKVAWESVRDPAIDEETWVRLTEHSLMPLDRALLFRRTGSDLIDVTGTPATHPLVDLDYGLVLTPGGRFRNFTLDAAQLKRLQEVDHYYVQFPSAAFSVGAFRARGLLGQKSDEPWTVPEFEVAERRQLDSLIDQLRSRLGSAARAEIWFRGQTSDFLIDGSLKSEPLCPWRNTQDSSLIPSLYRSAWHGGDIAPYAEKLRRIQKYVSFARRHLGIQTFTTRAPGEPDNEKLPHEWDSYAPAFTSHQTDSLGNVLSSRDYHHAFDGLQRSFFLQHYGLPSNVLDITKDLDTALFFAENEVDKEKRVVPAAEGSGVLYVFILLPGLDRFLDSSLLSEHYGLLRPARQHCGLLCGASFLNRNHYARYIGLKIKLRQRLPYDPRLTPEYVYPPREEDVFLNALLAFSERHMAELGPVRPFAPTVT